MISQVWGFMAPMLLALYSVALAWVAVKWNVVAALNGACVWRSCGRSFRLVQILWLIFGKGGR